MASAAAVATDISRSPLHDYEQTVGITGTITSADNAPSTLPSKQTADDDDDEDDDDIRPNTERRRGISHRVNREQEEERDESGVNDEDKEDDDMQGGLFGSDDEDDDINGDDSASRKPRQLDDEDLDSADDEDRDDRYPEAEYDARDEQPQEEELSILDVDLVRHPIPEPTDGELYLLKIPTFLSIDPQVFQHQTFQPPTTDHHSRSAPSATFSAYNTAMSTVRWRRSPKNPNQLQSNARVVRWSDGSLTLQFASKPANHYPIAGDALVQPQQNPSKPTPLSVGGAKRMAANGSSKAPVYKPELDAFTYLCAGHQKSEVLRITNKFTAALKVQSAKDTSAEALERLQTSLAAAGNAMGDTATSGIGVIKITEDPELAKKKAEIAEKEKLKAQRRREAQEARDRDRQGRAFGRRGPGLGGGLTVGGLEDEDELGRSRGRYGGASGKKNQPKRSRRGEIYSDDEDDYGRRGRTREDEYDQEDDFVAPSDEEEEIVESDGDEDDGIMEQPRAPKRDSGAFPRRQITPSGEQDAEGDLDDDAAVPSAAAGSPAGARKRRRVIDDDDEE